MAGLDRFIATPEVSRRRVFSVLSTDVLPDHKVYAIAVDDDAVLAVLLSRAHLVWSLAAGGRLGVGNDPTWTNTTCFRPFPFPEMPAAVRASLRGLGKAIHDHRTARQKESPALTLTDTYNVLAKLRTGAPLTAEDEKVRAMALADTLQDLHDQLDRAVADAYGWPHGLPDDEVLTRLVALNAVRAAEEAKGLIRWLWPDLQAPQTAQAALAIDGPKPGGKKPTKNAPKAAAKFPWPTGLPGRIEALVTFLRAQGIPMSAAALTEEGAGAALDDILLTLQCAAAAQAVTRLEDDEGREVWAARA